jgi:hypothetical protein
MTIDRRSQPFDPFDKLRARRQETGVRRRHGTWLLQPHPIQGVMLYGDAAILINKTPDTIFLKVN